MVPPPLPPELEYSIFLLAYRSNLQEGKYLLLVAKRVFEWLIPLEFNIVKLSEADPYPIHFNESTYQKYGHHVRHLMVYNDKFRSYLPLFPKVTNLAFWATYEPLYLHSLLQMPLERISAGSTMLSPDFFQLLASVTHLDYMPNFSSDDIGFKNALYLPRLTHLCVLDRLPKSSLELFLDRERCPALRVVVVWSYGSDTAESNVDGPPYELDDDRVMSISCNSITDWMIGARGGVDMWKLADELMAERTAGMR